MINNSLESQYPYSLQISTKTHLVYRLQHDLLSKVYCLTTIEHVVEGSEFFQKEQNKSDLHWKGRKI